MARTASLVACFSLIGVELMAQTSLTQELHVKETQAGFAGEIGWSWTVEPDGTWRAQRIGPPELAKQSRTGKFSPAELEALSKAAAALGTGVATATENAGPVNSYTVEVNYGEKTARLVLPAGGGRATRESTPEPAASSPTLNILHTLREATWVE